MEARPVMTPGAYDELKTAVLDALKDEGTAIDVFRTLAGIPYEIGRNKRTPCALRCIEPGKTRMYLIKYDQTRGDWRLRCDRCGTVWDAIEAVKHARGCEYWEAVLSIGSFLGLASIPNAPRSRQGRSYVRTTPRRTLPPPRPRKPPRAIDVPAGTDQTPFYRECAAALLNSRRALDYLASRKIPLELARRYWLGYCPNVPGITKDGRRFYAGDGIIFPVTRWQWEARIIEPRPMKSIKHGAAGVWNWKALKQQDKPVYIAEGVFNALTIIYAGNNGARWEAVAIGGTSGVAAFVDRLRTYRKEAPLPPLIAALDSDEAGQKATRELAKLAHDYKIDIQNRRKVYDE